jgi:endonuclease/exonuclease/phosphatase family metal-dependent hydrolase
MPSVPLRVLTYNIWNGGEDRLPLLRDVIASQAPDLVALEEANDRAGAEWLAQALGTHLTYGEANSAFSIAWLSRVPIVRAENHRHQVLRKTLLEIEVEWEGTPLRLFAAHLDATRAAEGEARRVDEMRVILDALRGCGETPHLLVGDFNTLGPDGVPPPLDGLSEEGRERAQKIHTVPRLAIPLLLDAGYTDCFRAMQPNAPGYTFKAWEPVARLDFVFASPKLAGRLRGCDVVKGATTMLASDHLPIVADFA